jgi:flagellar basal-body rod protein FlgG
VPSELVDGEHLGIAILNHPASYRDPTRWHVRSYGLFSANPFAQHDYDSTLPDGTTAYSRDGTLHTDANGQLVTASGFTVSPAITIPANAQSVTIGQDGVVSARLPGAATTQNIGQLQLANFVNPAGLESRGNNLYIETTASGTPSTNAPGTNGLGLLQQGYLETSNVTVVEELVSMIQTQRAYEINSKAIQTSDQMLSRLAQL